MRFQLAHSLRVPKDIVVTETVVEKEEIKIWNIPICNIPVVDNKIGAPIITMQEQSQLIKYNNYYHTVEINNLDDILKFRDGILITHQPCLELGTEYKIEIIRTDCEED